MPGGLIQLAVYGSEDLFLTGQPQITFFKIVYRRHTNFAVESIRQNFNGRANFGQESTCTIEKIGDLMSKSYLEVDIPKVSLTKVSNDFSFDYEQTKLALNKIQNILQYFNDYMSENIKIIRNLATLLKANNISFDVIQNLMSNDKYLEMLFNKAHIFNAAIVDDPTFPHLFTNIKQQFDHVVSNYIDVATIKDQLASYIHTRAYPYMKTFYDKINGIYSKLQSVHDLYAGGKYLENYKFAWVEELGNSIIDYINIQIGNQIIDQHTGEWLIIFNQIFTDEQQMRNYYKMIGNVDKLTIFDDATKPSYKLIIPLHFWFCRHTGLSLPLIALRYNDINITVNFKKLYDVCYTEKSDNLLNIQDQYNINIIDAGLYIDYVFLDTVERKRFAQSSHEYLIETVQVNEFNNINENNYVIRTDFTHPTKFITWFAQPSSYRKNLNGTNKCQWNNFGTRNNKSGYTMVHSNMYINSTPLSIKNVDIKYYNYLQPYLYFNRSPTEGLNIYSFSIKPLAQAQQPSGSLNFSRIDSFWIETEFTKEFLDKIKDSGDTIYMAVYAYSYNILRIMSGIGGLAFERIS